jgi:K+-transporting ATPase ATPase C chain
MVRELVTAAKLLAALTLLTGLVYPLAVTAVARVACPVAAAGSLVDAAGRPTPPDAAARGSALVGQPFSGDRYFWGRLSATAPTPFNAAASGGSNLGPLNPALVEAAGARLEALRRAGSPGPGVPVDLVTASGSGLDPHISPAAAEFQVPRVARARGLPEAEVRAAVRRHTSGRQFGLLGEPRVNVLLLNLDLDRPR